MGRAITRTPIDCDRAAEFEYDEVDGVFLAFDGILAAPRRYPPAVFFQMLANAAECSRKHKPWARPSAQIIRLADHQAASSSD